MMDPKDNQAAAGSAAADLDALAAEARRVDNGGEEPAAGAGDTPPGDEQPKAGEHQLSTARLVQGVLLGAGNLLAMRHASVKRVYTAERCLMVGEAVAPVLDRWGINAHNSVAMQYLVAVGALAMLGMDTVDALRGSTHEAQRPAGGPKPAPWP